MLPSKVPNLLLNGSAGIAVGMATNIPPHNLGEMCAALLKLIDDPEIKEYQLVANDAVRGPDFPTGGQVLNTRDELREIYKTGQGADPDARHLGERRRHALGPGHLHHEHSLWREQGRTGRGDRRRSSSTARCRCSWM